VHLLVLNPLKAELNPICHLLALLGAHHILHVSGLRVNLFFANIFLIFEKEGIWLPCDKVLIHFKIFAAYLNKAVNNAQQ
jgi:hypothetical protein